MTNSSWCHNHKIYLLPSKLLFFIYHPFNIQGELQFKAVILLNIIPLKTSNFHKPYLQYNELDTKNLICDGKKIKAQGINSHIPQMY